MFYFVVIIIAILILSFVINMLLQNSVGSFYRIFVAPGVIAHELSHAFACYITGAKVSDISMFKKEGGEVKHGASSIPVLGSILISTAPFVVGAILIYLLSKLIGFRPINLVNFDFMPNNIAFLIKASFSGLNFAAIKTWIGLYLVLSIAMTMIPSLQDMKNMFLSLIFIFIMVFIIYRYTNFRPDMSFLLRPELFVVLTSVLFLLIIALILSMIIYVVKTAFTA